MPNYVDMLMCKSVIPVGGDEGTSILFDILTSYDTTYSALRSIDFYLGDDKITNNDTLSTSYGSVLTFPSYSASYVFDTSLTKIDGVSANSWFSPGGGLSWRICCVFNDLITFDGIIINNFHSFGGSTWYGAKDIEIYTTNTAFVSTTVGETVPNGTLIFDGTLPQHVAANTPDEYDLALI